MRKYIMLIGMIVALVVMTTACGTKPANEESISPEDVTLETLTEKTTEIVEEEQENLSEISKDANFYTIYLDGITYKYEYQDDKILSIKAYIEFDSAEEAEEAANVYRKNGLEEGIKDVYSIETTLVIESDESELDKITVNELDALYEQEKN